MNTTVLLTINGWAGKNSLVDHFMVFCAKDLVYVVFLVTAVCAGYLIYERQWKPVSYFMATLLITFILLQIAAHTYVDRRPFMDHHLTQLVAHASGKSFPSDHTTVTAAIALGLLFFTRLKKTSWAILVAAVVIGFARVFVGIHYPVDILGGLLTGLAGVLITFGMFKLFETKRRPPQVAPQA